MRRSGNGIACTVFLGDPGTVADQKRARDVGVVRKQPVDDVSCEAAEARGNIRQTKVCRGQDRAFDLGGRVTGETIRAQIIRKVELSGIGRLVRLPDVRLAGDPLPKRYVLPQRVVAAQIETQAFADGFSINRQVAQDADRALRILPLIGNGGDPPAEDDVRLLGKRIHGVPCNFKACRTQRQYGKQKENGGDSVKTSAQNSGGNQKRCAN